MAVANALDVNGRSSDRSLDNLWLHHGQSEKQVCLFNDNIATGTASGLHRHLPGVNLAHCVLFPVPCLGHIAGVYPRQHLRQHSYVWQIHTRPTSEVEPQPTGTRQETC